MRTFDLDAFDAYDEHDRPGGQILPWEMWERARPWREDTLAEQAAPAAPRAAAEEKAD